ncbi:MAG: PAS domain-containing protein [Bacteroidota bacterium]|nr:PAS domain-containing protein [Bacteroidota bacterium]
MNKSSKTDSLTQYNDQSQMFNNLINELLVIVDINYKIKWTNGRRWQQVLGYSASALLETNLLDLVHPEDKEYIENLVDCRNRQTEQAIIRLKDKKGSYRWVVWNCNFNSEEQQIYASAYDITEEKFSKEGLTLLGLLGKEFSSDLKSDTLFEFTLGKLCKIYNWPYGEIWINRDHSNAIVCACSFSQGNAETEEFRGKSTSTIFKSSKGLIGKIWSNKKSMWINDFSKEKENLRLHWLEEAGFRTIIAIPVINRGEVSAVMVFYLFEEKAQDKDLVDFLKMTADHIGNFIERKNAEEKLRKNERILSDTQKLTNTGSWEWDVKSNRIYWTNELFNIYGIQKREVLDYETVLNFLLAEDREIFNSTIKEAFKDHQPFTSEYKLIRPDGEIRILKERGEVLIDYRGEVYKIIGTVHDITSLIKTEERLKKSQEYYRSLIENALDIKSILNREGHFLYVSPSVEKTLGYKASEFIGKNIIKYIHPEDISKLMKVFIRLLRVPDKISSVEFRIKDKQGKWRNIESIMKNLLNNPSVCGVVVNSRDITLRKEAETTIHTLLNVSKRLNSTLNVDKLMDALVEEAIKLTNAEGGYTGLRTAEGMVCKKVILNSVSYDFEFCWPPEVGIPGKLIKNKGSIIINNAESDPNIVPEIREKFKLKTAAYVSIQNSQGDVIGFLGVTNKINNNGFIESDKDKLIALSQSASTAIQNALAYQKIQAAEFQLKNSREQLRRLSAHTQSAREEERTRISREIHDELGQALTGLKMDLSWLEKRLLTENTAAEPIQEKIAAMYSLINSTIKSVRKISSELRPGVLDYLGITAAIEWQAQEFQSRTGIECKLIRLPKELTMDQNFSTALFRIFQETLTNVARHANATVIEVELLLQNGKVILRIHDNGRGITDEEIINTKSFGLLGMRERAYLLGGEFNIKGTPGNGTTVTVTIPVGNIKE